MMMHEGERRPDSPLPRAARTPLGPITVLSLAALALGAGTLPAVSAAPNPTRSNRSVVEATIAADGSYRLRLDQTVDLAFDSSITFGSIVPDGFRLPDGDGPIPPYLRPEYGAAEVRVGGDVERIAPQREFHRLDYTTVVDADEGPHSGQVTYEVRGAALAVGDDEDAGAAVYIRPLRRSDLRITSAAAISGVDCFTVPPLSAPCGHADGDDWVIPVDDVDSVGGQGAVRVRTALDPKALGPVTIDD